MKKLLLLILIVLSNNTFAQSLSLSDLIKLHKSSLSDINEFLVSKSWTLIKSHHDENIDSAYFVGNKWTISTGTWQFIEDGKVYRELNYEYYRDFYSDTDMLANEKVKILTYKFSHTESYTSIKNELKNYGYTKFKEYFGDNAIQISYKNNFNIVRLTNYTTEDKQTIYYVHVLNILKHSKN